MVRCAATIGSAVGTDQPRWTAYDAKFSGIKMPEDVAMTVQDRAYTSPIWYMPEGGIE